MSETFSAIEHTVMQRALALAAAAGEAGEAPVGAVVYGENGGIIGEGQNRTVELCDPGGHAEMLALRAAAAHCGNYRLGGYSLAVTLEPCAMCAGAIFWARLDGVVYGAADPKSGAVGSVVSLHNEPYINHHTTFRGGLMAEESAKLLREFFQSRRSGESLSARAEQIKEEK